MRGRRVRYAFEDYVIDSDRRELTRSAEPIAVGPQVFDLLLHLSELPQLDQRIAGVIRSSR